MRGLLAAGRDADAGKVMARAYELEMDARVISWDLPLAVEASGMAEAEMITVSPGIIETRR